MKKWKNLDVLYLPYIFKCNSINICHSLLKSYMVNEAQLNSITVSNSLSVKVIHSWVIYDEGLYRTSFIYPFPLLHCLENNSLHISQAACWNFRTVSLQFTKWPLRESNVNWMAYTEENRILSKVYAGIQYCTVLISPNWQDKHWNYQDYLWNLLNQCSGNLFSEP